MAPRRTSFTSSLPPIPDADSTTFCSTRAPTPPHTPRSHLVRPRLSLPNPILSLSSRRSPLRTQSKNSCNQQPSCSLALDPASPIQDGADESDSTTSSSDDEFEDIFASSPIEQHPRLGSPESGFISSPCTSRSSSPGLMLSPKAPSPAVLCSTPPVLRESHIAGLFFMKPLVLGVKLSARKPHGTAIERGLDIQQVTNCKRASTPVKTPTIRGRSNSLPVNPSGVAGGTPPLPRHSSMRSTNNGKPANRNIVRSIAPSRSLPPSPVLGRPGYNRQY